MATRCCVSRVVGQPPLCPADPAPQSEPLDERQVANSAGGHSYPVDDMTRLQRFLILGSAGGSYYADERKLTLENAAAVKRCITASENSGIDAVGEIIALSQARRAPKPGPLLFALAMAASYGSDVVRWQALNGLPLVAHTGSHLHMFIDYVGNMRRWGRGLRRAVGKWYTDKDLNAAVYQAVKYRPRYNWNHRDLLRKAHPKAASSVFNDFFAWITQGTMPPDNPNFALIRAYEQAKTANPKALAALIRAHDMTWEMIPSEQLDKPEVWEALAERMPLTALIRNLATLTRVGAIAPMKSAWVCERLNAIGNARTDRIHPIAVLSALLTYRSGKGARGSNTWTPVPQVVDALDQAFDQSFATAPQTNQRFYLGIDVSGRREPNYYIEGFANGSDPSHRVGYRFGFTRGGATMAPLSITASDSLNDAMHKTQALDFGATDCALPMLDALEKKIPVDVFVILAFSEWWRNSIRERSVAGQAKARAEGRFPGRRPSLNERQREYIREIYGDTATIREEPIAFPEPKLENLNYRLDHVYAKAGNFTDLLTTMGKHRGVRYNPTEYLKAQHHNKQEYAGLFRARGRIVGMIKALMVKRLESSIEAFRSTLGSLTQSNRNFRAALDAGYVPVGSIATRLLAGQNFDPQEALAILEQEGHTRSGPNTLRTAGFDVDRWKRDLDDDHAVLNELLTRVSDIGPADDDKLETLKSFVKRAAIRKEKLLIFSEAETTVDYLYRELNPEEQDRTIARLSGNHRDAAASIIRRFAPRANLGENEDLQGNDVRVLIATDIVSEGQNLQDCARVLNYDLHWNPVRLIQRFGRVDRIGSPHEEIHLHNMLPDMELDESLGLTSRLGDRIQGMHDLIGLDNRILSETERLNPNGIGRIYEEQSLPEEDDEFDELTANQRAIALLQHIKNNDPNLWKTVTELPDGIRSALPCRTDQSPGLNQPQDGGPGPGRSVARMATPRRVRYAAPSAGVQDGTEGQAGIRAGAATSGKFLPPGSPPRRAGRPPAGHHQF